ncbi:putative transcription factor MYB-related family [Helianthus annuus]|uniref:Putative homeodomain-like protein n=1 Tax=Helianthus annuus TaxID=4232 RepID=A0A251UU12_HELAN|nr:uncharacterized protein LOC110942412 [Helianthus annuus]KAF5807798.1 putative transcription factor MYB-related family [Helianthus annuus]
MQKQGASITEQHLSLTLQRYSPTTILTLLHEVAQVQDVKIDWNALIKHTKTGITNPREYQILWRHLAYCDPLLETLEKDTQPVDDDSDLECEREAFPTVSNEASAEAAACVKVLMASSSPNDIERGSVIEAPLTINIPRTKHPLENPQVANSVSGVSISVPVFVPTQLLPTVPSAEGLDNANGGTNNINLPPRRKRKPWSAAEDRELFAAVQKYGEGNWTHIVKSDFKGDRTASQLSQRWNIIKKRQNHPLMKTGSHLSEAQLAARRALNMALDKPGLDIPKPASSLGRTCPGNTSVQPTVADPPSTTLAQNYDSTLTGPKRQFPRPQPFPNRPLASGSDAVKAAAVAAGARIATQSAAAAILKQQLKSAIHIKTTRSPPAPGAHMGPDYFRAPCSRVSPNTPKVGPVVPLNQSEVKPWCSANSPELEPIQEDQVAVSSNLVANLGSKDQCQDTNPPNMNLEPEGR